MTTKNIYHYLRNCHAPYWLFEIARDNPEKLALDKLLEIFEICFSFKYKAAAAMPRITADGEIVINIHTSCISVNLNGDCQAHEADSAKAVAAFIEQSNCKYTRCIYGEYTQQIFTGLFLAKN